MLSTRLVMRSAAALRKSVGSLTNNISRNVGTQMSREQRLSAGSALTQLVSRPINNFNMGAAAAASAALLACTVGQYYYGDQKDFYDYRFVTDKDPDDLAGFYGSENFMDIFCVLPFMGTLMMRGGTFDEEGTVHTTGFPGSMQVSMVFSDEMDDDGTTKWFNKRERFRDVCLGFTCWDMVTNFGFEKLPDGRTMVYHHAEHHINHYAFQNETDFDESLEHESREDMPLFLLKNYAWSDLMAGMFGHKVKKPSFLLKKSEEAAAAAAFLEDEDDEEEDLIEEEDLPLPEKELPFQRPVIMRRITADIRVDRRNSRIAMREGGEEQQPEQLAKRQTVKQRIEMDVALDRHHTLSRKMTNAAVSAKTLQRHTTMLDTEKLNRHPEWEALRVADSQAAASTSGDSEEEASTGRESLGGNPAWEALRSTNNPQAYKAATVAAAERFIQRRATVATMALEEKMKAEREKASATAAATKQEDPTSQEQQGAGATIIPIVTTLEGDDAPSSASIVLLRETADDTSHANIPLVEQDEEDEPMDVTTAAPLLAKTRRLTVVPTSPSGTPLAASEAKS